MQTFCGLTTDGMLEYLAAIYLLLETSERVTTSGLAEKMNVSAAAASSMLKRLQDSGFVERSNTDGITLTQQGILAALQLIRRHRLLEVFLIEVMGFTWDQVELEANRLEHAISDAFVDRMEQICHYPSHCPHGDPIPSKDGEIAQEQLVRLVEMEPGQTGLLRRVGIHEPTVLRYLSRLQLTPGRIVKVVDVAPFNGPVTLELKDLPGGSSPHTNGNGVHTSAVSSISSQTGAELARRSRATVETVVQEASASEDHAAGQNPTQILGNELAEQLYVVLHS